MLSRLCSKFKVQRRNLANKFGHSGLARIDCESSSDNLAPVSFVF